MSAEPWLRRRAGLRERRTLPAAPALFDGARWGRVMQPAPGGYVRPDTAAKEALMQHRAPVPARRAQQLAERAAEMRARPTPSESRLWSCLRARKTGVEFRRQVVIAGKFIVDFLAPAVGLIVEIDGPYHSRRVRADESRDRKLRRLGYGVLRLEAVLVEQHLEKAVALIRAALAEPP